jgi:hypothetical protein
MTSPVTNAVDGVTLVTKVVLTWVRVFLRQRTEKPPERLLETGLKLLLKPYRLRSQAPDPDKTEEDHQYP